MATLHVLRVFTDQAGEWGNPLGVFLDGDEVPEGRRQALARELGFSETVFVDNAESGECRIYTPGAELPFAGHPSVGTAWLLAREGHRSDRLRVPAGEIEVRRQGELTFIAARAEWSPPFDLRRLVDARAVERLPSPPPGEGMAYLWAWEEEAAGVVRSRCFPVEEGITEDEATGSAAISLCVELGRELTIHQGRGSLLHVRPLGDGRAEVGGRVALDEVREHRSQDGR
jgi:predicted PhzF superfamily epimerase YddE/YHI9